MFENIFFENDGTVRKNYNEKHKKNAKFVS